MFSFVTNLWEILIVCDYVNQFIKYTEACDHIIEEIVHSGNSVRHLSDF